MGRAKNLTDNDIILVLANSTNGLTFADIAEQLIQNNIKFTYQELGKSVERLEKQGRLCLLRNGFYINT